MRFECLEEPLAEALEEVASLPDAEADRRRETAREACRSRYGRKTIGEMLLRRLDETPGAG